MGAEVRLFTLAEAERALPLVRRIVTDVREEHRLWRIAVGRYELAAASARAEDGETPALRAAQEAVTHHAARVAACLGELEAIGCELKDFESGLVDFHALRDDRVVYLCWRLDEARITHWHALDAGVAGRQPLDPAILSATHP